MLYIASPTLRVKTLTESNNQGVFSDVHNSFLFLLTV